MIERIFGRLIIREKAVPEASHDLEQVGYTRILEVIEPLLGGDCHVIANTAWRNPPTFPDLRACLGTTASPIPSSPSGVTSCSPG